MKYIDMHIHLEDYSVTELDSDTIYVANSVDMYSYLTMRKKFSDCENVKICFGFHPAFVNNFTLTDNKLESLLIQNKFVGEIGLDFFWVEDKNTYNLQIKIFKKQLEIAKKYNLVPMIHTKGAEVEVLNLLKEYRINNALIHWYSGPINLIEDYLKLGSYFTIGPDLLKGAELYKYIPLERVFLETDNPTGIPWIMNVNSNNRGSDIRLMYEKYSSLMGLTDEYCKKLFYNNYLQLLRS